MGVECWVLAMEGWGEIGSAAGAGERKAQGLARSLVVCTLRTVCGVSTTAAIGEK